jgi:spore coat protein CotH
MMKKIFTGLFSILFIIVLLISMTGCTTQTLASESKQTDISEESSSDSEDSTLNTEERPDGWSTESHSNEVEPDYETVFPQDKINRIDITIREANWETMLADMTELFGEFGQAGDMGQRPQGNIQGNAPREIPLGNDADLPPDGNLPEGASPENEAPDRNFPGGGEIPEDNMQRPGGNFDRGLEGGGMGMDAEDENPVWVTATIEFEGDTWEHVGIRFKGNSSLRSAWSSGNLKIPFKLDFDQFEDEYPEIDDQRFYGFKQLSLANNFSDQSFLHEKVTADIFRDFGVPAAHTAFYEIYVDYGEGPTYLGLYTMVEMIEDTVIEEQFSSDEGNLYKPSGTGATFAEGSFTEASFDKETNQDEDDYSDILALFDTLHDDPRLSEPETWRKGLEAVFDVDTFLRWLAVNTLVQNWDTYGVMSHNYYLYTDPESGLITWIPWDNNMALTSGAGFGRAALSLSMNEVTEKWPLIRFLMDDPVYQSQYKDYLGEVVETAFEPEKMAEIFQTYHDLVAPYVLAETEIATMLRTASAFENSVDVLIQHVKDRTQIVQDYLSN